MPEDKSVSEPSAPPPEPPGTEEALPTEDASSDPPPVPSTSRGLNGAAAAAPPPVPPASTKAKVSSSGGAKKVRSRHRQKRYTHSEKRYHSEVRQEAVQQALAAMKGTTKAVPLPSKRSSVLRTSKNEENDDSGRNKRPMIH